MRLKESHHSIDNQQTVTSTKFVFMTSIMVTRINIENLIASGRLRWKIENEGFNIQKNGGYELHHKMNRKNIRGGILLFGFVDARLDANLATKIQIQLPILTT